jgi:hypothetical protein
VRRRRWHEIPAVRAALGLHSPSLAMTSCCACRMCRPDATWRDRTPAGQRRLATEFAEAYAAAFNDAMAAVHPAAVRAVKEMAEERDRRRAEDSA